MAFDLLAVDDGDALLFCEPDRFDDVQALAPAPAGTGYQLLLAPRGGARQALDLPDSANRRLRGSQRVILVAVDVEGDVARAHSLAIGGRGGTARPMDVVDVKRRFAEVITRPYAMIAIR